MRPAGAWLALLLAGFLAYGAALQGEFLWDDVFLVEHNPFIRAPSLFPEAFRHFLFHDSAATFYRPIQTLSYGVDYALWGLDAYGYRLTNLVLHVAAGGMLYSLARRLLPKFTRSSSPANAPALCLALLWLAHPVHNAAVAYVAGRADSLAAGFALLAWWLYEGATEEGVPRRSRGLMYASSAAALLLALFSKEMAAVWIALFALRLAFIGNQKDRRARIVALVGALLCLGFYAVSRATLPAVPTGLAAPALARLAPRGLLVARALGDYGGLLLLPGRLCMERQVFPAYGPGYNPELNGYYRALTFTGPIFLALVVGLAAWPGPVRRLRAFGAVWFLVGFVPISNLFVLNASVAEHWLYVPSVGFGLLLVGVFMDLITEQMKMAAVTFLLAVALPAELWRTAHRAEDWTARARFIPDTVAHGGDSPRMRNMLASLLAARGDLAGGERILRGLVQQSPHNATAALNLANNLRRQGRLEEAGILLTGIVAYPPTADPRPLPLALNGLDELDAAGLFPWPSAALPAGGNAAEALDAALLRYPQSWDLLLLRVNRLARREGQPMETNRRLEKYLRACPWNYAAWMRLAEGRAAVGDVDGTLEAYAQAGGLDTRETQSWLRRAILFGGLNRPDEAREMLQVAKRRGSTIPGP